MIRFKNGAKRNKALNHVMNLILTGDKNHLLVMINYNNDMFHLAIDDRTMCAFDFDDGHPSQLEPVRAQTWGQRYLYRHLEPKHFKKIVQFLQGDTQPLLDHLTE